MRAGHGMVCALVLVGATFGCSTNSASPGGSQTTSSDGTDSTDAADGTDGTDQVDGTDGTSSADGTEPGDGTDGTDGTDQSDGTDGTDTSDGTGGTDGTDGGGDAACQGEAPPVDTSIVECTCLEDGECCEGFWDYICAEVAIASCGLECTCDQLVGSCEITEDCLPCDDDGDVCTGGYVCEEGSCVASEPVTCDSSGDSGCLQTGCDSYTGECVQEPNDDLCADEQFCTDDVCGEDGSCSNPELGEGCGMNIPCKPSDFPGSSDAGVTACVCALDDYCCENEWDGYCVSTAEADCGLTCDCATASPADLACTENADCAWCGSYSACGGGWTCEEGSCVEAPPIVCEGASDGCIVDTCQEADGTCALTPQDAGCDDEDECTADACNADGTCSNEPIEFCGATSCEDRCGNVELTAECQCDAECAFYEDCCEDLCTFCSEDYPDYCTSR